MPLQPVATVLTDQSAATGVREVGLSDEQYVQAALAAFRGRSSSGQFRQQPTLDPAHALGAAEQDALDAVGLMPDARTKADAEAARSESLNVFFHVFESALPTAEVARWLGRDPSRIRQRVREGSLLALEANGEVRLPALQFHRNAEIPGLGEVLRALPPGTSALEALSWFATPAPDLADDNDAPRSPRDYLLQTGDAVAVIDIAQGLAHGEAG